MAVLARLIAASVSSPAAETAVLTTPILFAGSGVVRIVGSIDVTEGTGGSAYVVKLHQGNGTGGTLVGQALTDTVAAAASDLGGFSFEDASGLLGAVGGGQYTLTVAETGASAAGTIVQVEMQVEQ